MEDGNARDPESMQRFVGVRRHAMHVGQDALAVLVLENPPSLYLLT